jgi:UDP-N-acetylmuramoyl-tripeptide--D-alanyl-D-alanine ligase
VIALSAAEIAAITGGTVTAGPAEITAGTAPEAAEAAGVIVTGPVVIDSRQAVPGALFAALPGEHVDGHDYAAAALDRGAAAVLATRPLPGRPGAAVIVVDDVTTALGALARAVLRRLPQATVVGITGSSGKTSTKDLTAAVVERLGPTVAPAGSLNNELGLPLTVLRADAGTRYLILEMSARGVGHIAYLCGIAPPRIGAVLNVGRAHAGEFGSVAAIAKAKGELVEALPADGVAILNRDDHNVAAMAQRTRARVVTFGLRPGAGVAASDIRLDELGRGSFRMTLAGASADVRLRLHGGHHIPNALAAAAIAAELGMEVPAIAAALGEATARSGKRMEVRERPDGVLVVNDAYNANPGSTRAALEALAHLMSAGRRGFAVLGYMAELGDIADASHEEVGRIAARAGVTGLIAVGEQAAPVLTGARAQPGWTGEAIAVPHADDAIGELRNRLRPGDVVLVKASKSAGLWEVADGLLAEGDQ